MAVVNVLPLLTGCKEFDVLCNLYARYTQLLTLIGSYKQLFGILFSQFTGCTFIKAYFLLYICFSFCLFSVCHCQHCIAFTTEINILH